MANDLVFLTRLIAATITAQQNRYLLAKVTLQSTEIAYYREQLPPDHRLTFTDTWRMRFARAGSAVAAIAGWKEVGRIATAAKDRTIQGWEQLRQAGKLGIQRAGRGRRHIQSAIEKVILRLAKENPAWGQRRIAAVLALCLLTISPRTIAAVLKRHGQKPAPQRTTDWTWRRFVTEKADQVCATDFFTVETWVWSWLGPIKRTYDVLFAIHHATRQVEILGVTEHSNQTYMVQTAKNATMEGAGWLKRMGCRYLIHDRDAKFCEHWQQTLRDAGIDPVAIPAHSPNCNAVAERWVRTIKTECIRHCWFLDYAGLCRVLREYADHYNRERPHQSLGNRSPTVKTEVRAAAQNIIAGFKAGDIRCVTRCDGAIRHYYRAAA
jgi:putative transposase